MPIEFKCEINGLNMCETCEHGEESDSVLCQSCSYVKCPIVEGYEYMSNCKQCSWKEKEW